MEGGCATGSAVLPWKGSLGLRSNVSCTAVARGWHCRANGTVLGVRQAQVESCLHYLPTGDSGKVMAPF